MSQGQAILALMTAVKRTGRTGIIPHGKFSGEISSECFRPLPVLKEEKAVRDSGGKVKTEGRKNER